MEENSGKERMKILSNITNTSGVEDCEQDDYHYNTNSCSEETEVRSSSASKRNENKENPSLMKRMLRGSRSVKQLPKSSNPPLSPGGDVPDGGRDGRKANTTTNAEPEAMGTGGVRPKSSSSGVSKMGKEAGGGGMRTRHQLSRTHLLTLPTLAKSSIPTPSPKGKPQRGAVVSGNNVSSSHQDLGNGTKAKKNFVKANVLALANTKVKSSTHLEVPAVSIGQGGKKMSGSSQSLNSDPGSSSSHSFKRATDQQQRKSYHHLSRTSNYGTVARSGARSKTTGVKVTPASSITPKSAAAAGAIRAKDGDTKSPKPIRPSSGKRRPEVSLKVPSISSSRDGSTSPSEPVSRRSSFTGVESEVLRSLRQKQEHFQLLIENLQSDVTELRANLEDSEGRNRDLTEEFHRELEALRSKNNEEKDQLKDFFLEHMELQRSELRDEIRKLLSFKESSPNHFTVPGPDKPLGKSKSFKDSKEKLFHKIHRLSARMSMQDHDMKELQEVKSWNEKKLESELNRLQDSVKKPDVADPEKTRVSESGDDSKSMWTAKQGSLEQQLASCGTLTVSEPDLSGMFDTDHGVINLKMQRLAPSMSTLESFPPPSPALSNNSATSSSKKNETILSHGRV